jgi:hypothetical protein
MVCPFVVGDGSRLGSGPFKGLLGRHFEDTEAVVVPGYADEPWEQVDLAHGNLPGSFPDSTEAVVGFDEDVDVLVSDAEDHFSLL